MALSQAMTVTVIGIASGAMTALVNLALSKKTEGRVEITTREVAMATGAVIVGSGLAYFFIKRKEEEPLIPEALTPEPKPKTEPATIPII